MPRELRILLLIGGGALALLCGALKPVTLTLIRVLEG
jgi:hypothetical protein